MLDWRFIMSGSNASPSEFGTDFQVGAAIFLALENFKELSKLRMEGKTEDIELTLKSGKRIYAQSKSVVKARTDFSNVRRNLKNALTTLSNADSQDVIKLVFITNSNNPLNENVTKGIFYGPPSEVRYNDLPDSGKKVISDILIRYKIKIDLNKLVIKYFMFQTDIDAERYKVISQKISEFINSLNINISSEDLMNIWKIQVFQNGSKIDTEITIDKKEMVWPLIVLVFNKIDSYELLDEYDVGLIDEIIRRYDDTINNRIERYDVVTKVIYDFKSCKTAGLSINQLSRKFIENTWFDYISLFSLESIQEEEVKEGVCKLILSKILQQRYTIDKIKQGVAL